MLVSLSLPIIYHSSAQNNSLFSPSPSPTTLFKEYPYQYSIYHIIPLFKFSFLPQLRGLGRKRETTNTLEGSNSSEKRPTQVENEATQAEKGDTSRVQAQNIILLF